MTSTFYCLSGCHGRKASAGGLGIYCIFCQIVIVSVIFNNLFNGNIEEFIIRSEIGNLGKIEIFRQNVCPWRVGIPPPFKTGLITICHKAHMFPYISTILQDKFQYKTYLGFNCQKDELINLSSTGSK